MTGQAQNSFFLVALLGMAAFAVATYLIASLVLGNRAQRQARIAAVMRAGKVSTAAPADASQINPQLSDGASGVAHQGRTDLVLQQAGLKKRPAFYLGFTLIFALVLVAGLLVAGINLGMALLLGLAGAGTAFALFVSRARRQRLEAIEREFPAALDIMVRSLRAGLPVDEGLRVVAQEAAPIVASEFYTLVNEMAIGLSLNDAVKRMADRVSVPDVRMFAVVLGLQRSSGGSAATALEAVAETLRSRRNLRQKVAIMSSEARASAAIIGSLPVILIVILYLVSPEYIGLLFTTMTGRVIVAVTIAWMLLGVQVMRSMIHFDA